LIGTFAPAEKKKLQIAALNRATGRTRPMDEQFVRDGARAVRADPSQSPPVFVIRDDGSTNGTFVNDRRIHAETELRSGDLIRSVPLSSSS
jgi:hypothetical protein